MKSSLCFLVIATCAALSLFSACGGGGGSSSSGSTPGTPGPPLVIISGQLRAAVVNRPYSETLHTSGGTAPYTWSVRALPSGLALNGTTGEISGAPSEPFNGYLLAQVTDSSTPAQTAAVLCSLTVYGPLRFTGASLAIAHVNRFQSQPIPFAGGAPPVTWRINGGSLPAGLRLNVGRKTIEGTPTEAGSFSFLIHGEDSASPVQVGEQWVTLDVVAGPPVLTTSALPRAVIGRPYSVQLQASDGTPPYTWSISPDSPAIGWLSLSTSGLLSGIPTGPPGEQFVGVDVTDSSPIPRTNRIGKSFDVVLPHERNDSVANATPIFNGPTYASLSPFGHPPGGAGSPPDTDYYKLLGRPGSIVHVETWARRTRPNNPLDTVIEIVDGNGQRFHTCKNQEDDNPSNPNVVRDSTPTAFDDECLNDDINTGVLQDSMLDFQVPSTPDGAAVSFFYLHVLDWRGDARPDMTYRLQVSGAVDAMTLTIACPNGIVGTAISCALNASGGIGPYSFALAPGSGPLPPGLTLTSDGAITGTPTVAGTYPVIYEAQDSRSPLKATYQHSFWVFDPLAITTASLPDTVTGADYAVQLTVTGGSSQYNCISIGAPPGIEARLTTMVGSAVSPGTYTLNVQCRDSGDWRLMVEKTFTINVGIGPLRITAASPPGGNVGLWYYAGAYGAGGVRPYGWSLAAGSLPPGLSLHQSADPLDIIGYPTAAGTYNFTLQLTDAQNPPQQITADMTIVIF